MGLLVIGVVDVTRTVVVGRDLGAFLDSVFVQAGFGHYTADGATTVVGWLMIVLNLVGLAVAIGLAVPRLRERRPAFWVPVLTGITCTVLTTALTLGAAVADPAFTSRLGG